MPFIPAENRTSRRSSLISNETLVRDVKDGIVRLTTHPDDAIHSTRSSSRLISRRTHYTTLVDEFVLSCKELEVYKWVDLLLRVQMILICCQKRQVGRH